MEPMKQSVHGGTSCVGGAPCTCQAALMIIFGPVHVFTAPCRRTKQGQVRPDQVHATTATQLCEICRISLSPHPCVQHLYPASCMCEKLNPFSSNKRLVQVSH
jgi:hypothetical protein